MLLVARYTVFATYQFRIAQAAHSVMPADSIRSNTAENAPHIRVACVSLGQAESVLRLQGIRHVVAFQFFLLVKEQDSGIGAAHYIHQAQRRAPADNAGPVAPAG